MRAGRRLTARARALLLVLAALLLVLAALLTPLRLAAQEAGDGATDAPPRPDILTLREAVAEALGRAPEVRAAEAGVAAAEAGRWADWGAFLPTASGFLSFSRSDFRTVTFRAPEGSSERLPEPLTGTTKFSRQGLSLDLALFEGGTRLADLKAGAARSEGASLRLEGAERAAAAAVRRAYYSTLRARRLAEVARRQLEARRRELELTRRRYLLAAVDRSDLLGAESQVRRAELALMNARDGLAAERRALAAAVGREGGLPEGTVLADVEELPSGEGLDADALVRRALSGDPELGALTAESDAASASLWAARAEYLPTVSLGYSVDRSESLGPEGDFFVLDPSNRSEGLNLRLTWSLFDGFSRRERTGRLVAERARLRWERNRRELELAREVRDLAAEVERRWRRLGVLRADLEINRRRAELVRERYRLGTASFLELQNAIDRVSAAEEALIRERYDYLLAWADLEERTGPAPSGLPGQGGHGPP